MDPIRSIVVPTDFSELAQAASVRAAGLARLYGSEIHLVHAFALPAVLAPYEMAVPTGVLDQVRQALNAKLDDTRKAVEARGVQSVTAQLVDAQQPDAAIADAVRAHRADLVVMGTHGYGGLKHVFLGSVAERTLRRLDVPILAVKGDAEAAAKPIAKILVAVDFSPHSDRAVATAAALATRLQASVDVVHAFDIPYDTEDYLSAIDPELEREIETRARAHLTQAKQRIERDGVKTAMHFRRGRPHSVIADLASAIGCQLIVMGTHGRTGLAHALLGSVAERTLRAAPCSVLCVRAAE
jgi:nucleotide-binding universal stress UspA family protein